MSHMGDCNNQEIFQWGSLLIRCATCLLSIYITAVTSLNQSLLTEVQDKIAAVSAKLDTHILDTGDCHVSRPMAKGWKSDKEAFRHIWKGVGQIWTNAVECLLVSGVPETRRATFPFSTDILYPNEGFGMAMALGNGWISFSGGGYVNSGGRIRSGALRPEGLWSENGTEDGPGWIQESRTVLGSMGMQGYLPSGSCHDRGKAGIGRPGVDVSRETFTGEWLQGRKAVKSGAGGVSAVSQGGGIGYVSFPAPSGL